MKLVYTEQSLVSLEEALEFIAPAIASEKLVEIRDKILNAADIPNISSTINKEQVIFVTKEYEDHIEKYNFILHDDGIFKRTSYSEEKL